MANKKKIKNELWNVILGKKGASAFPAGEGDNEELYYDYPICQATKAAKEQGREPTKEDLKEVLRKAKEQGAIVGGEWFKEENNT